MEQEAGGAVDPSSPRRQTNRIEIKQDDLYQDSTEPNVAAPNAVQTESTPSDDLLAVVAQMTNVPIEAVAQALKDGDLDQESFDSMVGAYAGDVRARWLTITDAYPELLPKKGTDSKRPVGLWTGERHTFMEVNNTVFRFPFERRSGDEVARELVLLAELNNRLPGLVSKVKYHNPQASEWFKEFIGYSKIPGRRLEPAFLNRHAGSIQLAHALGGILSEVHATKLDDVTRSNMEEDTPDNAYKFVNSLYQEMPRVTGSFKDEDFERTFENFFAMALEDDDIYDFRPTIIHSNFSEHVVFSGTSHPAGVFGWSNAQIGDPAVDLADVMHFVGPGVIADVFAPYQTNESVEQLWKRTLVRWGIGLLLCAAYPDGSDDAPAYVYIDLVREQIPRLLGQTPRAGKRSMISKAARLRRS